MDPTTELIRAMETLEGRLRGQDDYWRGFKDGIREVIWYLRRLPHNEADK